MTMRRLIMRYLKYLNNTRGNINAFMGIDLFANLMFVFLIVTIILLKAPKENEDTVKNVEEIEMKTPNIAINLPKNNKGGIQKGRENVVSVSAKPTGNGDVNYFVDKDKTSLQGISALLKDRRADSVELRLDESLPNSVTVKIITQLQQANIREIYYIFVKN